MKSYLKTIALISLIVCSGCVPFWRQGKSAEVVPMLPVHESWCYKTLGQIDCYPKPQRLPPESLVSVDPPSRFPTSREAYAKALAESD